MASPVAALARRVHTFSSLQHRDFGLLWGAYLLQVLSPDRLRGRMMGTQLVAMGLMPVGSLVIGGMAEPLGTPTAVTIGAAAHLAVLLGLMRSVPRLRSLG